MGFWIRTAAVALAALLAGCGGTRRGDIPILRLGGRLLVKRLELERMLGAEVK